MRFPFLALLSRVPAHGSELKQAFNQTFGAIWPELNFGQVYTTLASLERDGLVQEEEVGQDYRRDQKLYAVTGSGREALRDWIEEPLEGPWVKDELFMKLALARLTDIADPLELIAKQRLVYLRALHDLNGALAPRARASADGVRGVPHDDFVAGSFATLLMEGAALHLEADLKWLDACERAFAAEAGHVLAAVR